MISARWLEKRKPYWDRLESIVQRSGRGGLGALSHEELRELGLLYRQVAADLSSVREDPMSQRIAGYLNQLLGRAHNLIYMGRRARPGGILEFYRAIFPRIFRETFKYTLAAFAVFLGAAVAGLLICLGGLLFPGSLPRRDALVVYGGQGVRLALGIVPMLIVAGVIEAFLSPSFVPAPAKFLFASAVFGLFALYVTQAGRTNNRK